MARVDAASAPARAGSLQGLAHALAPAPARMADIEPTMRRLVPVLVAVFLAVLVAGVTYQITQQRDRAFQDAISDLELVGFVAATQIDAGVSHTEIEPSLQQALRSLPGRALAGGRQVLVTDAAGEVIAAHPDAGPRLVGPGRTLAERLGPAQPLTTFAEKAGVLRITLADGTDAFATVRTLKAPLGQIAIIHPIAGLLQDWWSGALRTVVVLLATTFVLTVIAAAYLWQSRRAHAAERHYGKVHGRIDTALNRGRCGLWDWDLARGRIYWSESMYAMLGMEAASEFVSFGDINALVHPLDDNLTTLAERLAATELQAIDHVFRLRNTHGAWVWLRVRAELVREPHTSDLYLVGIAVDVSDEKRLAERSATADRRLSDAIEAISESFALWDADDRLVTCNAKYLSLHRRYGEAFPLEAGAGQAPNVGQPTLLQTWQHEAAPPPQESAAHDVQLPEGGWLQVSELRTKDGGLVCVGTDITAHKVQEQRLMDSERRLMATIADLRRSRQALELQAQQLAEMAERHREKKAEAESANRAKAVFLANMSHELRTPLNAIIGFSDLMCGETFGPLGSPKYADYAADIRASGEALLALISDVLDMSRLEAGRVRLTRTLFPVDDLVESVARAVEGDVAAKRLQLTASTTPGCVLHADRTAVEKVLRTILDNACRFTEPGGSIAVRVRQAAGGLNIFVADNGCGIVPEDAARLGRPFEQLDAPLRNGMKGSGLGLAIARSVTELHGGVLRLKSRLGTGTLVMIHFPAPRDPAPPYPPQRRARISA